MSGELQRDARTVRIGQNFFAFGTVFSVNFGATPRPTDWTGNSLPATADLAISTFPTAPREVRLTASTPGEGETDVPTNGSILLQFSQPIGTTPEELVRRLELRDEAGQTARFQLETTPLSEPGGSRYMLLRPVSPLSPNRQYTVGLQAGVRDVYANLLPFGDLFRFRTASARETRVFRVIEQPPFGVVYPSNGVIRWRFSRPIDPLLGVRSTPSRSIRTLNDGAELELAELRPGLHSGLIQVFDRVEHRPLSIEYAVRVSGGPDHTPPTVRYSVPAAQSVEAFPTNGRLLAVFDEAVWPGEVRLFQGDTIVPGDVVATGPAIEFRPRAALAVGVNYRFEVTGSQDLAGNTSAPFGVSFTAGPPSPEPFSVVRIEPPNNAVDVDRRQPWVIEFNRPPNPRSLEGSILRPPGQVEQANLGEAAASNTTDFWTVSGNTATYTPKSAWPRSAVLNWSIGGVTDWSGSPVQSLVSGRFATTDQDLASASPRIVSSPVREGETLVPGSAMVSLSFPVSLPLDRASVNPSTVVVRSTSGRPFRDPVSYNSATQSIDVALSIFPIERHTILVRFTSGVISSEGAPLEPFEVSFHTVPTFELPIDSRVLIATDPAPNSEQLAPDSPIVVYFRAGIPRAPIEEGLFLLVNDIQVSFDSEWAPDGRAVTLRSRSPFPPLSTVTVLLSRVPWGLPSVEAIPLRGPGELTTATVSDKWIVTRSSVSKRSDSVLTLFAVPTNSVFDLEFNREVSDDVLASARASSVEGFGNAERPAMDPKIVRISPRTLRLENREEMTPEAFVRIALRFGSELVAQILFRTAPGRTRSHSGAVFAFPAREPGGVPLNSIVRVVFPAPVNALHGEARLEFNGVRQTANLSWSDDQKVLTFQQTGLLRPASRYTLILSGLQDISGSPYRDLRHEFETGQSLQDAEGIRLLFVDPAGPGIARDARIRLFFNRPHFLPTNDRAMPFDWTNTPDNVPPPEGTRGWVDYEDGGRTVVFVPAGPLPAGREIPLPRVLGTSLSVRAGATRSGEPPRIVAVTPFRNADQVPPDAMLQMRFSEPVLRSSLAGVSVEADGRRLEAMPELSADGRVVTILGGRMLPRGATVTVRVTGVAGTGNLPMEGTETWGFRTSSLLPPATPFLAQREADSLRIRFNQPLNPVSVLESEGCYLSVVSFGSVAVRASVEENGFVLRCVPNLPLNAAAGEYTLGVGNRVTSWTGLTVTDPSNWRVPTSTAVRSPDAEPPRIAGRVPLPGGTLDPLANALVTFDERVATQSARIRIWQEGREVPRAANVLGTPLTELIRPAHGWIPGKTYQVEVVGATDLAGNRMTEPDSWLFSIGAFPQSQQERLRLLSVSPSEGSVGVDPTTPIAYRFSRPVGFQQNAAHFTVLNTSATSSSVPVRYRFDDSTLTFSDPSGWPRGVSVTAIAAVQDAYSFPLTAQANFTTAAPADTEKPLIESILPAEGNTLPPGVPLRFNVRFSEPVHASRVRIEIRTAAGGSTERDAVDVPAYGDGRVVSFVLFFSQGPSVTLTIRGATDLSGNPMNEHSFVYNIESPPGLALPRVMEILPLIGRPLPPSASLTLRFSQPIDAASLKEALLVTESGNPKEIELRPEDSGRTWVLIPQNPWIGGAFVRLNILAERAYTTAGILMAEPFVTTWSVAAPEPSAANQPPRLVSYIAEEDRVDLLFDAPVPEEQEEPFGLRLGYSRVPIVVRRMSDRWLRLLVGSPLSKDASYWLMLGPRLELPLRWNFQDRRATGDTPAAYRLPHPLHPFAAASISCVEANGTRRDVLIPAGTGTDLFEVNLTGDPADEEVRCHLPMPSEMGIAPFKLIRR